MENITKKLSNIATNNHKALSTLQTLIDSSNWDCASGDWIGEPSVNDLIEFVYKKTNQVQNELNELI